MTSWPCVLVLTKLKAFCLRNKDKLEFILELYWYWTILWNFIVFFCLHVVRERWRYDRYPPPCRLLNFLCGLLAFGKNIFFQGVFLCEHTEKTLCWILISMTTCFTGLLDVTLDFLVSKAALHSSVFWKVFNLKKYTDMFGIKTNENAQL